MFKNDAVLTFGIIKNFGNVFRSQEETPGRLFFPRRILEVCFVRVKKHSRFEVCFVRKT